MVADLRSRLEGRAIVGAHLTAFSALKTFDPPLDAFMGLVVDDVSRHGKFLDVEAAGLHLVIHLSRAGWVRWKDAMPAAPPRPGGKGPLALRIVLDDDSGFDVTEAGTQKRLAVYAVRDPGDVPGIARLGPDPLDAAFTRDVFAGILRGAGRSQQTRRSRGTRCR
ncbi:MAG: Fpg/Nei family DNA glycosylase, partial [Actinomycetia bacterium]|nr:Fpg/Nei family DNA glycosylase [Actinomycetes bacterium]